MILIFYITHKVISLHGENQIESRNDITPDWSHGWNNFDQMLMQIKQSSSCLKHLLVI
ncbi:hypothetical protein Patl1_12139 [Pistacia atlantica]|uniref:Uncharacterized protein n=1 Tax=Pistacia atlantica TaxID=434234 RepID=A0ACC1A023_9ROSI|nr:hypothetical protein Patl1_12139 [Pistacia atlantica]